MSKKPVDMIDFDSLPDHPMEAILAVCSYFEQFNSGFATNGARQEHISEFHEWAGLLEAICTANAVEITHAPAQSTVEDFISKTNHAFGLAANEARQRIASESVSGARTKYAALLGKGFFYEFSEGDLKQIQERVNQLRDFITNAPDLDENHRERLLKRLEQLQREIHKKMSNLDKFWGLIGDAGVVLGKLGKDARPFVDCIKEIAQIVWHAQSQAEQLPSSTPFPRLTGEVELATESDEVDYA